MRFIDRKAKYPGRWTMKKSDGTSEVVTLVRNDEPIVEGTPMNANTLNTLSDVAGADVARAAAERSAALASSSEANAKASEAAAGKAHLLHLPAQALHRTMQRQQVRAQVRLWLAKKQLRPAKRLQKPARKQRKEFWPPSPMNTRKCRQSSRIPSWSSVPYNLSWMPCVNSMKRMRFYCRRWSTVA